MAKKKSLSENGDTNGEANGQVETSIAALAAPEPRPEPLPAEAPVAKTQPAHIIRLRNIRAAVWLNETEHGPMHNVTVQRLYKVGPDWRTSNSFGRDDLLLLAEVLRLAHLWIFETIQAGEVPF